MNRQRVCLTVPSQKIDKTLDNIEKNLVVYKGDILKAPGDTEYIVVEKLGQGTFGQVFRCVSNFGEEVAIKIVKNENKYYQYELHEVRILKMLKEHNLNNNFVEILDGFIFAGHLCIVLELLNKSMLDLFKVTKFLGLPTFLIRNILEQILISIDLLHVRQITHGDLKPENILLSDAFEHKVKIIDFSSSQTKTMCTVFYAQSRYYRAPEVILGIPYSNMIDIWSFGCIAYEMIVGEPLFPGRDNEDQIHRIVEFFNGRFPTILLDHGENTKIYFNKIDGIYKPKIKVEKFTINDMAERIFEKIQNKHEADSLVDMISCSIDPFYLQRSRACTILQHPYFQNKPVYKSAMARHLSTNKDLGVLKYRNSSIYESEYDIPVDIGKQRKHSQFDFFSENKSNRNI